MGKAMDRHLRERKRTARLGSGGCMVLLLLLATFGCYGCDSGEVYVPEAHVDSDSGVTNPDERLTKPGAVDSDSEGHSESDSSEESDDVGN